MENLFIFLSLNSENVSIWENYENCFGFPISRGMAFGSLIKNCFLPEKKNAITGYKPTTDLFPCFEPKYYGRYHSKQRKKKAMTGPMEMDPVLTMYGVLEKIPM